MNKHIKIIPVFIERNRRPALRSHLQLNNITNSNIMKTRISISAKLSLILLLTFNFLALQTFNCFAQVEI